LSTKISLKFAHRSEAQLRVTISKIFIFEANTSRF
jgi:hypothetical protein